MSAFATIKDYETRYGAVSDQERVECLLEDASSYLRALYAREWNEDYEQGKHKLFDDNACAVVCSMVSRMDVPTGMEGITTASQSANSYSASYTFANPTGDLYITKAEKERLGFGTTFIGTIAPMIGADHA